MPTRMGTMRPRPARAFGYANFSQAGASPNERWFWAGQVCGVQSTTGTPSADGLYAFPQCFHERRRIDTIAFNQTAGATGGAVARCGIYSNLRYDRLYPDQLLFDGGEKDCSSNGVKSTSLIFDCKPDQLYWFVYINNNGTLTVRAPSVNSMYPIIGTASTLGIAVSIGWLGSFTYAALPAIFPASGTAISSTVAGVAYRLGAI